VLPLSSWRLSWPSILCGIQAAGWLLRLTMQQFGFILLAVVHGASPFLAHSISLEQFFYVFIVVLPTKMQFEPTNAKKLHRC
jgi:hypothetical protein